MDKQASAPSAPVAAIPVVEYTYLDLSRTQPIPEDFITVGCCAFRCSNFETEKCIGCKSVTQCLCAEEESYVCKMAPGQQDYCCVVGSGACELVNPVGIFKIYRQIFCFELICGCPVQEAYFDTQLSISKSAARSGSAAAEDIVPCSACCCDFTSLYLKWPECCGIYSKSTMVCLEREYVACKPAFLGGAQNPKQNLLCLCAQGNCLLVPPKTCVKAETQEFCFDYRCALPCDEDVPCLCMPIMFCTCCVNGQCYCGCCQSLQTIRHLGRPPAPPAVSTQQPNPAAY